VIVIRNWFFDIRILKTTNVSVPVISVGNISVGGVGKTPIVEMLIERLMRSYRIAVVSRGYGRKSSGTVIVSDGQGKITTIENAGDEPIQLAGKFSELIIVVDEKRVRGAQKAVELGAKTILLDDGFQHRYVYRDLNIVVMSAEEILKDNWLLPAGNRREPMKAIGRANLIVISRCGDTSEFKRAAGKLESYNKPAVGVRTKFKSIRHVSDNKILELKAFKGKKAVAFSGIGNPRSFEKVLAEVNLTIAEHVVFSDHHWYSDNDIKKIIEARRKQAADFIVTTEKDVVRLRRQFSRFLETEPIFVAEIQQEVLAGEEKLNELLKQVVR
jgi:tetraacyldisaccharide 4'-kinase